MDQSALTADLSRPSFLFPPTDNKSRIIETPRLRQKTIFTGHKRQRPFPLSLKNQSDPAALLHQAFPRCLRVFVEGIGWVRASPIWRATACGDRAFITMLLTRTRRPRSMHTSHGWVKQSMTKTIR